MPLAIVSCGSRENVAVLMDLDELVDHWTLLKDERELVAVKRGPTRRACYTPAAGAPAAGSAPPASRAGRPGCHLMAKGHTEEPPPGTSATRQAEPQAAADLRPVVFDRAA